MDEAGGERCDRLQLMLSTRPPNRRCLAPAHAGNQTEPHNSVISLASIATIASDYCPTPPKKFHYAPDWLWGRFYADS